MPASVDSKPFTQSLSPLDATLAKTGGGGALCGATRSDFPECRPRLASYDLLLQRRRRIIWQLVLAGVRPLHFQLTEQQRRADNRRRCAAGSIAYQWIVTHGDQIIADRTNIQFIKHRAAHQLFMPILCIHPIE